MSVPLAYIGLVIIWSTTPLAIKWSGEEVGFLFGVGLRMAIALLLSLIILLLWRKVLPVSRKAFHVYLAVGLPLTSAMGLVYWGAQHISSGLISVLFGLTPVFTGIFATMWLEEKSFTLPKLVGMLISFAGLFVIFQQAFDSNGNLLLGMLAVLVSAFVHSLGTVWMKQVGRDFPIFAANTGGLAIAVLLYTVLWGVSDGHVPEYFPERAIYSITYLAISGSVFGALIFYYALKRVSATSMGLLPLITPATALIVGQVFNGEQVQVTTLIGTTIIVVGLAIYQWAGFVMKWIRQTQVKNSGYDTVLEEK